MIKYHIPQWMKDKKCKEYVQDAKEVFEDYKAEIYLNDNRFLILDLYRKNCIAPYSTHYVFDKSEGTLLIYSDYSNAMAAWSRSMDLEDLLQEMERKRSIVQALCACSDYFWEWSFPYAWEELKEAKEASLSFCKDNSNEVNEINEDFQTMETLLQAQMESALDDPQFKELWSKYKPVTPPCGKRLAFCFYLWTYGFLYACDRVGLIRLKKKNKGKKSDSSHKG